MRLRLPRDGGEGGGGGRLVKGDGAAAFLPGVQSTCMAPYPPSYDTPQTARQGGRPVRLGVLFMCWVTCMYPKTASMPRHHGEQLVGMANPPAR
jgi:hypothetical protein